MKIYLSMTMFMVSKCILFLPSILCPLSDASQNMQGKFQFHEKITHFVILLIQMTENTNCVFGVSCSIVKQTTSCS